MPAARSLTHKLLERHLIGGELEPGREVELAVDQILIEDATGTMTGLQFQALGAERAAVPLAVMYVDHNVLQIDDQNMDDHQYLQSFCARYGLRRPTVAPAEDERAADWNRRPQWVGILL